MILKIMNPLKQKKTTDDSENEDVNVDDEDSTKT